MDTHIELRVPARLSSIHLLRTVVASAAARFDASVDDIDDLRIAVTEAASELLAGAPEGGWLGMVVRGANGAVHVSVTLSGPAAGDRRGDEPQPAAPEQSLAWQVLLALATDVRFVRDARLVGLEFAKPMAAGPVAP